MYAATTLIDEVKYPVVMNIGTRPTVDGQERSIEAHIIGLDKDLYNRRIQINMQSFIRKERKFDGFDSLKIQIHKDLNEALQLLK